MTTFATPAAAMDAILYSLRGLWSSTRTAVENTTYWFADKEAARSAVLTAGNSITWLGGEGRQRVLAGTLSFEDWKAAADAAGSTLAQVNGYNQRWEWSNVAVVIAKDAGATLQTVAESGASLGKWVVVGLIAVLVLLYAPRPAR